MDLTKFTVISIGEGAVTNYTGLFSGGASLSKKGLGQLVMSNGANADSFSGDADGGRDGRPRDGRRCGQGQGIGLHPPRPLNFC